MAAAPIPHPALSERLSVPETLDEGLALASSRLRGKCLVAYVFLGIAAFASAALLRETLLDAGALGTARIPWRGSVSLLSVILILHVLEVLLGWFWLGRLWPTLGVSANEASPRSLRSLISALLVVVAWQHLPLLLFGLNPSAQGHLAWLPGAWLLDGEDTSIHLLVFLASVLCTPVAGLILPIMISEGASAPRALGRALRRVLSSKQLVLLGAAIWFLLTTLGYAVAIPLSERHIGEHLASYDFVIESGLSRVVIEALITPHLCAIYLLASLQLRRRVDGLDVAWAAHRAGLWTEHSS